MKCDNCPLTYSDYSEIIGDGDCYCLVTNDYVLDEGCGCRRTNKWIKSQDRKAWLNRLEEQRDKAIEDYVAYCEAEREKSMSGEKKK